MKKLKTINQKTFEEELKKLKNLKVTDIFQSPVNMMWIYLENEANYNQYQLVFDGFWLVEQKKKILAINQDFYQESEKDFMKRLNDQCILVKEKVNKVIDVSIGQDCSYIELVFDNDVVLLAKPNNFGFIGLKSLEKQQFYSIDIAMKVQFTQE